MGLFLATGFVLAAAAATLLTTAVIAFWNDIKDWLNNTAANVVQKYIGYDARQAMQKAVCKADRVMNKVRNVSEVYYKKNRLDTYYDKVTMETEAPAYEINQEVLDEIAKSGSIIQTMEYKR